MVSKMPMDAYRVFVAKEKVNKLTEKIFKNPNRMDESDAFRHFVWSALLTHEMGKEKAKLFLDAHEEDSTQSSVEKKMDMQNNKSGIEFALGSKKNKDKFDLAKIEKEALERLRRKKLKVIKPQLAEIPGGYYSK
ncbi:MAG: hypothetical protein AAF203_00975 [Pseudomonadota bacterium]